MTLTLTITDNVAGQRLVDDFCVATKWDAGSGITKADWVRQHVGEYLKLMAKRGEFKTAQVAIVSAIDAIVIT